MNIPQKLYGIIGHPLRHTLSPRLHNSAFQRQQWPGVYLAWSLLPENLADFIRAVRLLPIHGLSVTLPYKEHILPLCDWVSSRARRVGAVNTLYWQEGTLCGENTDVQGFVAPLVEHMTSRLCRQALILGAGGAARAVIVALQELGTARIGISNHHPHKAAVLAEEFALTLIPWEQRAIYGADLYINTTPLGMQGRYMDQSPMPVEGFVGKGLAYDLVYNPLQTRFLREAAAAGWDTQDGLDMFVGQGRAQFQLWTGITLNAAEMRQEILAVSHF